jgi:hypothetical protein
MPMQAAKGQFFFSPGDEIFRFSRPKVVKDSVGVVSAAARRNTACPS